METLLTDYSEYRKMLESEMNQKSLGGNQMVESAIPSVPTYSRDTVFFYAANQSVAGWRGPYPSLGRLHGTLSYTSCKFNDI